MFFPGLTIVIPAGVCDTMKAESYDLDGLIISGPVPFQFDVVLKHYHIDPLEYVPPEIPPLQKDADTSRPMTPKELVNYGIQAAARVESDMWQYLWDRKSDVFGNTGRPNKQPWIHLTRRTLEQGYVFSRFKDIYYRPDGMSGVQSKGAAIRELSGIYDHVTHFDDDPWVIFGLAKIFPDVTFVLVQELKGGLLFSREETERFPNVRRIAQLKYVDWTL